jgi:hypothetical protein
MLAVLDDAAEADGVLADLADAGVRQEDLALLGGSDDAATLDRLGASRGVAARLRRVGQFLAMDQMPDLQVYERAVADGHTVVAARIEDADERRRAIDALRRHGAHFINRFGAWATEEISPWRGEMPDLPQHLKR